jgi:hypothetical protein
MPELRYTIFIILINIVYLSGVIQINKNFGGLYQMDNRFLKTTAFLYNNELIPIWKANYNIDIDGIDIITYNDRVIKRSDIFDVIYDLFHEKITTKLNILIKYSTPKYNIGDKVLVSNPDTRKWMRLKTILKIEYKLIYTSRFDSISYLSYEDRNYFKDKLDSINDTDIILIEHYEPKYIVDDIENPIIYDKNDIYLLEEEIG